MFSFMNILAKISKTENYTNWLLITGNLWIMCKSICIYIGNPKVNYVCLYVSKRSVGTCIVRTVLEMGTIYNFDDRAVEFWPFQPRTVDKGYLAR